MIKQVWDLDEVIDFAWELSQNDLYASYHRIASIEEIKGMIEKAIVATDENIIVCYKENVLCGLGIYHWVCEENYAQTTQFLVKGDYDLIADEMIGYIGAQLPGFELLIAVPVTNISANNYLSKSTFECIESSIVTTLYNFESNRMQRHAFVEEITRSNFAEYAPFHDEHALPLEMYYNSRNLQRQMEHFRVFVFRQDMRVQASIFVKIDQEISEVYGLFLEKEHKNMGIESTLINQMLTRLYAEFGMIKEIVYFIDENSTDELDAALSAGFMIKDKCRTYRCLF